ncbi:hypothetical protein [Archaeoglobus sp.]
MWVLQIIINGKVLEIDILALVNMVLILYNMRLLLLGRQGNRAKEVVLEGDA